MEGSIVHGGLPFCFYPGAEGTPGYSTLSFVSTLDYPL